MPATGAKGIFTLEGDVAVKASVKIVGLQVGSTVVSNELKTCKKKQHAATHS